MKIDIYRSPNLFADYSKEVETVLRKAVRAALMEHKRAGNTIVTWKNGSVHFIKPEEIVIESVATEQT
jgi:hypothetical protein